MTRYSKKRLLHNKDLQNFQTEDIDFECMLLLMENLSKGYSFLFYAIFDFLRLAAKNKWTEAYPSIDRIAHSIGYERRQLERFLKEGSCLVQRVNRFKKNKKASNKYFMEKRFIRYLNIFRQVGVFKCFKNFKSKIKFIRDMWEKSGYNVTQLMNILTSGKSHKSKDLNTSYKHRENKMSHTPNEKCRIDPYSSYSYIKSLCTGIVPSDKVEEFELWIHKKLRNSIDRYKWYTQDQKNIVHKPVGFLIDAFKHA